jgi:hypothetical protein
MVNAIIYTTNTGSTAKYAKLLAHETDLPVFSLDEAKRKVPNETEIIYLGWVMAGKVKGYETAAKQYHVMAVCAVGMGKTEIPTGDARQKSNVPASMPLFNLQGNFNLKKLHGIYRLMMSIMIKTVGKQLAAKTDRTPDEEDMLDMMLHGVNRISVENLKAVLEWYCTQE